MKNQNLPSLRLTRRQWAGALLTTAVAAQTPPSTPSTPASELQAADEHNHNSAETLAKVQISMTAEPAFHFTA